MGWIKLNGLNKLSGSNRLLVGLDNGLFDNGLLKKVLIGLLIILLLIFFYSVILYLSSSHSLLDVKELKADLKVENGVAGINADTDNLHFGTITPGGLSKREIFLSLPDSISESVLVVIESDADWISVDKNFFLLSPGQTISVLFSAVPPASYDPDLFSSREYDAIVKVYFFKKHTPGFLIHLLLLLFNK